MFCGALQAQNITELEYFFGVDPGIGSGNLVTATTNSGDLTQSIAVPLTGLPSGFQTLTFRAKNDANIWSLYHSKTFYISEPISASPIANLAAAEYWFGVDPGNGNGTALAISGTPSETVENFAIPLGGLEAGFHTLSIRIKNIDDIWSLYHRKTFYIIGDETNSLPSNLVAVEYWFNSDPGHGNGTAIPISGTPSETVENFTIPLGDLETGFHTLSIRIKNEDDTWSLFHRKRFYIISPDTYGPVSPLTNAEFLYDVALGFGTGTEVAITPTGNPDEYLVEIPTDLVTCDFHDVSLSVKNALGNYSLYDITVDTDVFDNLPPTIVVFPDITVELDTNGQAPTFTIANVDSGTFDDCELVSVVLNQPNIDYTCVNLGSNTVTITATDAEDKVSMLDVTVTVVDNINPTAITKNITVQLDANGNASITAEAVDNNSFDNCSITNKSIDVSSFTCADLGLNTVALTVTDESGNQNTVNAIVTVEDNINPIAIGKDITIDLEGNASVSIVAGDVDNGSNDNCGALTLSIDIDTFTTVGDYPVILTITDSSGNINSTTVMVTVSDTLSVEAFNIDSFEIFPNPTKHSIQLNFNRFSEYGLHIYDVSGKLVFQNKNLEQSNILDFSKFSSGVYFLKIKEMDTHKVINVKIIKQ